MHSRGKLTYANVLSTLCFFLLIIGVGGSAAYAHGLIGSNQIKQNAVKSWHIKNGQVKSADIKNNNVKSKDIKDGTVQPKDLRAGLRAQINDATSPWDTIPSGRTVTGRYYDNAHAAKPHDINLPARAPAPLQDSDLIVTGTGGNGTCTGSYVNPTAPAGTVCVYHAAGDVSSASTFVGSNEHDHHVFYLTVGSSGYYWGSWAYTAP